MSQEHVNQSGRLVWIDTARFLAMFSIALQHCGVVYVANDIVQCGAVALFFMLAGYFSSAKVTKRLDWKRFRLFVFPYLIWNIGSMLLYNPFMLWTGDGWAASLLDALLRPSDVSLWFLRDLMLYVLVAPLCKRCSPSALIVMIFVLFTSAYLIDSDARLFGGIHLAYDVCVPNWRGWGLFCLGMLCSRIPLSDLRIMFFGTSKMVPCMAAVLLLTVVSFSAYANYVNAPDAVLIAVGFGIMGLACAIEDICPPLAGWMAKFGPSIFLFYAAHAVIFRAWTSVHITLFGCFPAPILPWIAIPVLFVACDWCYRFCRQHAPFLLPLLMAHPRPSSRP